MKKIFLACLATSISALSIMNVANCQTSKNVIIYTPAPEKSAALASADVSAKAMKDFKKSFSAAGTEKWFKMKAGFTVEFAKDNITYRVDYDKKGNWRGTLKTYEEKDMPRDIRAIVKSSYYDYTIYWIKEVTVPDSVNEPVYIIHVEDARSFKNLTVFEGELNVLEAYKKG